MKKSQSTSKKRTKSPTRSTTKKRIKTASNVKQTTKAKETQKKGPRKSRWEDPKPVQTDPIVKAEALVPGDTSSIKKLLNEKEKLVEYLFLAVSGTTLQELIPDYLKKKSSEELKKLCLEELQKMTEDDILYVISGKELAMRKEQETQTDIELGSKSTSSKSADQDEDTQKRRRDEIDETVLLSKSVDEEAKKVADDENQTPEGILEEVAKDLRVSDVDPELLELEMRARAIRSLLKLKGSDEIDSDTPPPKDK